MPWFKIDDGFHGHPKVVELDLAAVGLWTLAGSWCAKYLTDGFIALKTVRRMGGDESLADALVAADLWIATDDGYQFNDWSDYQPLKKTVLDERKAAQERMEKVRAAKKGVRPNETRTTGERSEDVRAKFERSSEDVRSTPFHPSPARPDHPKATTDVAIRSIDSEFDEWWSLYPRKQAKPAALKSFKAARKTTELKLLLAGAQAYSLLNIGTEKTFLKLPAGWLNDRRWEDEQIVNANLPQSTGQPAQCPTHPGYPASTWGNPCPACDRDANGGSDF
ncbi:hypothetical protein [Subtercola sp. RTI3]|uniref:hypothetical protein n=1 Tax=Subtercola sp. RTI3 TaxID=3048639 RepID=UPI002B2304E4|nr:hypothetical protein [Subtercola sp. RTI3]MEA9983673.1 hypothetical protein [Subtercola sp. RTI3]